MTMFADDADLVIGVDTHRDTHTASAVSSPAGIVLDYITREIFRLLEHPPTP
jgi:hypothetical protein